MEVNGTKTITNCVSENIVIASPHSELVVSGIVNGKITVQADTSLVLSGILNGDLQIDKNGVAVINGVLHANQIVLQGALKIFGIVECKTGVPEKAALMPGCIVNGIQH